MGCHFLFQEIFLTQGSNPGLLNCRQTLPSEPPGDPTAREEPIKSSNMAEYIEKGEHKRDRPGPLEFGGTGPRLLSVSTAS